MRVPVNPGSGGELNLQRVLRDRGKYLAAYERACRQLERRYGADTLAMVMNRLAPDDVDQVGGSFHQPVATPGGLAGAQHG